MLLFEPPVLDRQVDQTFLKGAEFAAQALGTSPVVAARAVLPASRHVPVSMKFFRTGVVMVLPDASFAAKAGDVVVDTQAFEHDSDIALGEELPTGPQLDSPHLLRRRLYRRFYRWRRRASFSFLRSSDKAPIPPNHNIKFVQFGDGRGP